MAKMACDAAVADEAEHRQSRVKSVLTSFLVAEVINRGTPVALGAILLTYWLVFCEAVLGLPADSGWQAIKTSVM